MAISDIDGELLRTESLRSYERDPGMYLPTRAVNELITRNFAPAEVRMRLVTRAKKRLSLTWGQPAPI